MNVTDWLVDLLGLPAAWRNQTGPGGGVLQSSASDSTHLIHVVARERATVGQTERPAFVAYTSAQAHYMETVGERQVMPDVEPGDIAASIPATAPEKPEQFEELIGDLDKVVMPGITHWQSPGWFAYYPATTSGPSILGELVSAGLGVQGMLWSTSPAATE